MELTCKNCGESRMVEIVTTKNRREAFCAVCSFSWNYEAEACACQAVPIAHYHDDVSTLPPCPKCGKAAQMSTPAA